MIRLLVASCLAVFMAATPVFAQTPAPARPSAPVLPPASKPAAPVAAPAPAPAPSAPVQAGKRIDVNGATAAELDALPGVGPVRSKAIVAGRPYDTIDAIATKKALPAGVLANLKDRLALANINTSSAKDMQRTLPGIGDVRAAQIVAGRPYATPADLVAKGVLTQPLADKIKDLIAY